MFNLTSYEFEQEPIDELFTNLLIYGYIEDMKNIEYKKAK